jgi:hypothetical protein
MQGSISSALLRWIDTQSQKIIIRRKKIKIVKKFGQMRELTKDKEIRLCFIAHRFLWFLKGFCLRLRPWEAIKSNSLLTQIMAKTKSQFYVGFTCFAQISILAKLYWAERFPRDIRLNECDGYGGAKRKYSPRTIILANRNPKWYYLTFTYSPDIMFGGDLIETTANKVYKLQ